MQRENEEPARRAPGPDPGDLARMRRDTRSRGRSLDKGHIFLIKTLVTMVLVLILLAFV